MTEGSFYHHFPRLAVYIDSLLVYWEEDRSYGPIAMSQRAPNEINRVEALSDRAASLPHETESALRAWGSSNSKVLLIGFQHRERPLDRRQLRRMFAEVNTIIFRTTENAST